MLFRYEGHMLENLNSSRVSQTHFSLKANMIRRASPLYNTNDKMDFILLLTISVIVIAIFIDIVLILHIW